MSPVEYNLLQSPVANITTMMHLPKDAQNQFLNRLMVKYHNFYSNISNFVSKYKFQVILTVAIQYICINGSSPSTIAKNNYKFTLISMHQKLSSVKIQQLVHLQQLDIFRRIEHQICHEKGISTRNKVRDTANSAKRFL